MNVTLKWVWELTPKQVFKKNRFVRSVATARLRQETLAFKSPKLPLSGTEFKYQLALSTRGRNEEAKLLRKQHADLPDSGDYRSGILIFKGDEIIASLILSGVNQSQPFKMVVDKAYQGQKLGERLLVEWWSRVHHTYRDSGKQPMSLASVKVLLGAYRAIVDKRKAEGRPVPDSNVIDAEAEQVLKSASEVEPTA